MIILICDLKSDNSLQKTNSTQQALTRHETGQTHVYLNISIHTHTSILIYIYIYMCVCVCVMETTSQLTVICV